MSDWIMLTIAMASAVVVVLLIATLRSRRVEEEDPNDSPDVIDYMTMMITLVYAIVLGLAIAGGWEAREAAEDTVRAEAGALHALSVGVDAYPATARNGIQSAVDTYVGYTVDTEWPRMEEAGGLTSRGNELFADIREEFTAYEPRTDAENRAAYLGALQLTKAEEARGVRGLEVQPVLPGVVWFGLIVGGMISVGMVFTLQIQRSARELFLAGVFSALIAFLLFTVWQFDCPYVRSADDLTEPFALYFPTIVG